MTRKCGNCTLCCKLLPVRALRKPANQRCAFQQHKGCRVYRSDHMPSECRLWNCRWLSNDDTADLSRPDRVHYVIDIMPDFVTVQSPEGHGVTIEVLQIWVDPAHANAWRDPDLLDYLDRRGRDGIAAIIRYSSTHAFTVFPPSLTGTDEFVEYHGGVSIKRDHSPLEIHHAINGRN